MENEKRGFMGVSDDELFSGTLEQEENGFSAAFANLFYENDGALEQYLKSLALLEPYGHEKESEMWKELLELQKEFREKISFFAVAPRYLSELLEGCCSPEELDEIFPQSLTRSRKKGALFQWLEELKGSLRKNLISLREAFEHRDERALEAARAANRELLLSVPVLLEHAFRLYQKFAAFSLYCGNTPEGGEGAETEKVLHEEFLCTREEFEKRFPDLAAVHQKMDALRHRIAEGNLRLVVSIAKPYHGKGVPFMDLIQEGNMGLMRAVDRVDFLLGHHFSTYATWWIRQSVALALGRQARVIRLPGHMLNTISRINRTEQHLLQDLGREPTVQELSAALEMPVERVNSLKKMASQTISLQATVYHDDEGKENTLEERQELSDSRTPLHDLARKVLAEKLSESIASLPERYAAILRMRYGLDGEKQRSLNEISETLRISKERIRQIEASAIAKLRAPENLKLFEDYVS
ncbi:MAG: sigma-70 family RNA polymerase sigma factor [Lentisphaeria bacterium]|nr:sigma-70 family RNA polymerase sigma factor [Lentisphaeria bacterium]